jgi:signal peptidase I
MEGNHPPNYKVGHLAKTSALVSRRILRPAILAVCLALFFRAFLIDIYQVPTGSMAPALLGHHRACICPRCGFPVQVCLHERDDGADEARERWYRDAFCPNCGATALGLNQSPFVAGERLLVDRSAYAVRAPRRWEIVVFHLFGLDFIKRVLGVPGETVEIRGGDLYVDGALCRKTLAEFKAMRILVFDNDYQPQPMTWAPRWESAPYRPDFSVLDGTALHLDAMQGPDSWQLAAYRHFCLDSHKWLPISDEYCYNGAQPCRTVPVHDVMLECDVDIQAGQGILVFGITDGKDHMVAKIPVLDARSPVSSPTASLHSVSSFSLPALEKMEPAIVEQAGVSLRPGKRYHVEWAFVDRRVMLVIDGVPVFEMVDMPECEARAPLVRPVMIGARGVEATCTHLRLWRDVHYTQDGKNGVAGEVVRLGPDQYFVLGDNSPRSEDSRFWPDGGKVPGSSLVGGLLLTPGHR